MVVQVKCRTYLHQLHDEHDFSLQIVELAANLANKVAFLSAEIVDGGHCRGQLTDRYLQELE